MKLQEVTSYNLKSATILNEGWQDLTESQRLYVGRWEKELWPLLEEYTRLAEATLTANQIQDIFKGAEAQANASGDNRNALGKVGAAAGAVAKLPVDMAKKVDAKINELGAMAKNAGPVKNADAKFAQLKKDITAKNGDSKIVQGIQKVSDWAKENPGKASLAVGILTTIAAFAGGPVGGAAAGLILRSTKELVQGEDLSTAIGKSVKTAAYGAIAGWALNGIGDWFEGLRFDSVPYEKAPGLVKFDVGFTETFKAPGITMKDTIGSMVIPESEVGRFTDLLNTMKEATAGGATSDPAALNAFAKMSEFVDTFDKQWWLDSNEIQDSIAQLVAAENDAFLQNMTAINSGISALAQGTASGKIDAKDVKVGGEPVQGELDLQGGGEKKAESFDMEDRFELFLMEKDPAQGELPLDNPNSMGAKAKRGLGNLAKGALGAVGKAAGKVKAGAKEMGTAVSAKKLTKQWKAAGEPADTASIMNILQDNGMTPDQIATIGQEAKVDLGKPSAKPKADAQASPTADAGATDEPTADAPTADAPTADAPTADAPASDAPAGNTPTPKAVAKGDTMKAKDGKEYKWMGALWVDTATNKPIGIIPSMAQGLPNPKLDPIISAAKKDPALAKLIKSQVASKGVEAGTSGAQKAAQAGVQGTEKLDAKGVTA
jgi:hypothetical protein